MVQLVWQDYLEQAGNLVKMDAMDVRMRSAPWEVDQERHVQELVR
jgi:hypothetical protein